MEESGLDLSDVHDLINHKHRDKLHESQKHKGHTHPPRPLEEMSIQLHKLGRKLDTTAQAELAQRLRTVIEAFYGGPLKQAVS